MHGHRRRKKRPNYGIRSVEVNRGLNGFGFTISGQQPCILSCIVANSPADLAGLRAGDFLISVNGLNVSKLPHESVVQLIGNTYGTIKMAIAENYYSDSSDDDVMFHNSQHRYRPKYPHHKTKINRVNNKATVEDSPDGAPNDNATTSSYSVIHSPNASTNRDISNVSAMVRSVHIDLEEAGTSQSQNMSLEYRAVVGYLGTIEMPKQIATSSKLQTVRSCIRKMRQEKRNPTTVLMTILPSCLNLTNTSNILIATYSAMRLSYVSSSSENDNKYFGLVTSAIYADGLMCEASEILCHRKDVVISNSCHVFVIDTKLTEHSDHIEKSDLFRIVCTKDPISNYCLEFPGNSEYIVNLIRSMYSLKSPIKAEGMSAGKPPVARSLNLEAARGNFNRNRQDPRLNPRAIDDPHDLLVSNSPQPSNHSEITTTSSNSDSGIGFHNDCRNISDRILVVDFPGIQNQHQIANVRANLRAFPSRPVGIINEIDPIRNIRSTSSENNAPNGLVISHVKSKSADFNTPPTNRLTVRAMPDPKVASSSKESPKYETIYPENNADSWMNGKTVDEAGLIVQERAVDVPKTSIFSGFSRYKNDNLKNSILAARSCDDMMMTLGKSDHEPLKYKLKQNIQMSIDDITLLSDSKKNDHIFLQPKPIKKSKKACSAHKNKQISDDISIGSSTKSCNGSDKLMSYKLSPKVFGLPRPISMSFENLSSGTKLKNTKDRRQEDFSVWGSLQELRCADVQQRSNLNFLEGTYSEPDLRYDETKQQLQNGTSPFRRWGQSSLRSRSGDTRTPTHQRRPSSLAASESDVYTKSMDDEISSTKSYIPYCNDANNQSQNDAKAGGPSSWGTSFEKLLEDAAGLHTFSEFLKKEFSAENIFFWTACERYRLISNEQERSKEALEIFSKHLCIGASEPVNVDSQARNIAQDNLSAADPDLFAQAQKQIFNLMKFDSYQRFIKSGMYKNCLEAETKNLPLPYPGEQLDPLLRTSSTQPASSKLKKSLSNAEDRRRKSLLPWHRKARCKSKDRGDEFKREGKGLQSAGSSNTLKLPSTNSISDIHSSRSSLSSFDASVGKQYDPDDSRNTLCRVILSNGATTVVQTRNNETIKELVERLLEKRGIIYHAYEGFLTGNNKPLDLDGPSASLAGKEVNIEQRVVFKLDLPNRKVISVKSKACKALGEVLRPILHKYNYRLDLVQTFSKENAEPLEMNLPVTSVDGQRLLIVCRNSDEWHGEVTQITTSKLLPKPQNVLPPPLPIIATAQHQQIINHFQAQQQNFVIPTNASAFLNNSNNNNNNNNNKKIINNNINQQNTLDEITNKVFNELLQGKVDSNGPQTVTGARASDQGSVKSEDWGSETSSGIFGRLRRRDSNAHGGRVAKNKKLALPSKSSTAGSEDGNDANNGTKKPLIAKWKAGVKLQVTTRSQNDELLEGLKRAQRSRLEDQRGTEINFELPDFLKDKENYTNQNPKIRKPAKRSEFLSAPPLPVDYSQLTKPQPAPRLSITSSRNSPSVQNTSDLNNVSTQCQASPSSLEMRCEENYNGSQTDGNYADSTLVFNHNNNQSSPRSNRQQNMLNSSFSDNSEATTLNTSFTSMTSLNSNGCSNTPNHYSEYNEANNNHNNNDEYQKGPPPLPPKPKILPIKPSNWGGQTNNNSKELTRRSVFNTESNGAAKPRNVYLDQTSSSFV